jgi:hypothetical protein
MTIGVRFPDGPFDPIARIQHVVDEALTGYQQGLDKRMRELLDAGIALERISIVSLDSCEACRGHGVVVTTEHAAASYIVTVTECPTCPGICIDGKSMRVPGTRGT